MADAILRDTGPSEPPPRLRAGVRVVDRNPGFRVVHKDTGFPRLQGHRTSDLYEDPPCDPTALQRAPSPGFRLKQRSATPVGGGSTRTDRRLSATPDGDGLG
ncbi:unnamed protein product [Diplocarpon coronariae]|uniref:Uncharacterized protein n=1 Tax=Diplocarpon coronariae TaxID=2795749 RepID=A0A218Z5S5_9HELO|nr:hypothetical protein B2J93_3453 [Marssonina coronariae]